MDTKGRGGRSPGWLGASFVLRRTGISMVFFLIYPQESLEVICNNLKYSLIASFPG